MFMTRLRSRAAPFRNPQCKRNSDVDQRDSHLWFREPTFETPHSSCRWSGPIRLHETDEQCNSRARIPLICTLTPSASHEWEQPLCSERLRGRSPVERVESIRTHKYVQHGIKQPLCRSISQPAAQCFLSIHQFLWVPGPHAEIEPLRAARSRFPRTRTSPLRTHRFIRRRQYRRLWRNLTAEVR